MKQVWCADDATGAGTREDLRTFWTTPLQIHGEIHGDVYGYHPNDSKTHLMIKPEPTEKAGEASTPPQRESDTLELLQVPDHSLEEYIAAKVLKWSDEIKEQASMATTLPHSAYCAYPHGLSLAGPFCHALFHTLLTCYNHWRKLFNNI